MVTLDRIRLTGLLREKPCDLQGFSYSWGVPRQGRVHHRCITPVASGLATAAEKDSGLGLAATVEPNPQRLVLGAGKLRKSFAY
jgi:hypothetical protein